MKFKLRKFSILLVLLLIISVGFNIAAALSDGAEPGSEQDPLISKSYVDEIVANNTAEVAQLKQQMEELKNQQQSGGSEGFVVLNMKTGQTLLPGGGTEIILRSGKAAAVSGQNGDNLADVTAGKDLVKGAAVVINHLLISSRDDGRGLKATAECYLLVRGAYKINDPPQAESSVDQTPQETGGDQTNNSGDQTNNGDNQSGNSGTPVEEEPLKGKITASALNVRSEPNTNATILGKAYKDDIVTIVTNEGEWWTIKTSSGVTGWVLAQHIKVQQ